MFGRYLHIMIPCAVLFFVLLACSEQDQDSRPTDRLLVDNGGLLADVAESMENQLKHIADHFGVEVVLATVPDTGSETIKEMAARLFTSWAVGREYDGNGLLILLADDKQEIRIEVGLSLEGVFTDLFTGYIEDKQLKSYVLNNQLKKARAIQPNHPEVIKNLAIAHVDAHYQYENALDLMTTYVSLKPKDPFGQFYRGYLLLMLEQPEDAIASLREGLALDPDNIYGLCKLVRAYLATGRREDRETAGQLFQNVQVQAPEHIRVTWLKRLLREHN